MKEFSFLLAFLLVILQGLSQQCNNYLYMSNNTQVQMKVYDKNGKESGLSTWKITDVKKIDNGLQSTITSSFTDDKGKQITKSAGTYQCVNGTLKADIRMSMPQEQREGYSNQEAVLNTVYLEYPQGISVGNSLNDADFKMEVKSKGGLNTTVSFRETGRKVTGKESITTPAGTWDSFTITYEANFRTQIAGLGIPFTFSGKEWFVPGFGVVKSETYNKNGKLLGSTILSSVTH